LHRFDFHIPSTGGHFPVDSPATGPYREGVRSGELICLAIKSICEGHMLSSTARQRATSGNRATLFAVALVLVFTFLTATRAAAEPPKHRLPIPDPAAQEKVLAAIQDTYKEDYDKEKAALAGKLLQKAKDTQDATERFVLLREAKNVAAETFQSDLAFEAIDELASKYDVSIAATKAEVVEQAAKIVRTIQQKRTIANAALQVVDEAIAEDNFDLAKQMVQQAERLARLKELPAKSKEVDAAAKAYAAAQEAMDTLKEKPDDPEANLIAGKYLCFTKADWPKGLPLLAKISNTKWQSLAERDLTGAATPTEQAKLGDAWWLTSKERAIYWYKKALPGLAGSEKDRVKKRASNGEDSLAASAKLVPTIIDARSEVWSGSTTNLARYGRLTFAVAMGKGDIGYGGAGIEIENTPQLTVAVEASSRFRYQDANSFAGFIIDYHTKLGYTKRVGLGIGVYDKERWESQPSWGTHAKPQEVADLGAQTTYSLNLRKWAPQGWDGKVWFAVMIHNAGAAKYVKAQIVSPVAKRWKVLSP
jgi:hypothetical protein